MSQQPVLKLSAYAPDRPPIEIDTPDGKKTTYLKLRDDFSLVEWVGLSTTWEAIVGIEEQALAAHRGDTGDDGKPVSPITADDDHRHHDLIEQTAPHVVTDPEMVEPLDHGTKAIIVEAFFTLRLARSGRIELLTWAEQQGKRQTSNGSSRSASTTGRRQTRKRG